MKQIKFDKIYPLFGMIKKGLMTSTFWSMLIAVVLVIIFPESVMSFKIDLLETSIEKIICYNKNSQSGKKDN